MEICSFLCVCKCYYIIIIIVLFYLYCFFYFFKCKQTTTIIANVMRNGSAYNSIKKIITRNRKISNWCCLLLRQFFFMLLQCVTFDSVSLHVVQKVNLFTKHIVGRHLWHSVMRISKYIVVVFYCLTFS